MHARRSVRGLAVAAALAATVTLAPAAHAESTTVHDGADASASLNDIRTVKADHRQRKLKVRSTFTDLRRRSDAGLMIFIDTNGDRRGPEFGLGTPLFSGSDYQMFRMRDWRPVGEPLTCSHRVRLDWADDVLTFTAARACLRRPEELRIGMRMRDLADGSHPITDWLIGRRDWTRWLARG